MSFHMTGKHRTSGYEYGRYVDSGCCHQKSRYILITVRDADQSVKPMCHCHTLCGIGNQISRYQRVLHSDMSHCDTIADSNCREHHRCSACFCHAKLNCLCNLIQVHMSWYDLVVRTYDADQRFLHFFFCHSKGIEQGTHKRMTEILQEYLPSNPIGVLSGPNHAEDICLGLPSASLIGFEDPKYADWVQQIFASKTFRVYSATDIIGMQLGGTIKNVFAIGAGLCEGLNLGDNAQAALLTRGLAEMTRIGVASGGRRETFMGLSGVSELIPATPATRRWGGGWRKGKASRKSWILWEWWRKGCPTRFPSMKLHGSWM